MKSLYEPISLGTIILRGDRPFLVAEAGVNHENSLEAAMKMVEEAAKAGADAIKFQSYKAETLAARQSPSYWDLKAEPTRSQFELFKKYDHFSDQDYEVLARHAKECGIAFMSTPFDAHFVGVLAPLMPAFKIASADLTNYPLLRQCAAYGKPLILSVGASTLGEIESAVNEARKAGATQIALLHCVLSYPCQPADANLRMIERLNAVFPDCIIGYSDHVPPSFGCLCLTTAWQLGARILEKHFTLDKTKPGNDHYHAMDPDDIRAFRQQCDYVTTTLGQPTKEVLACEAAARRSARRSLVAARKLPKGHVITPQDLVPKRPGTGIAPEFFDLLVGAATLHEIDEDTLLSWDMLMSRPNSQLA